MYDLSLLPSGSLATARQRRRIVALVPAHDEEDCIAAAIAGLQSQSVPPSRLVVVADRCSDGTVAVAERLGAEVVCTRDNDAKKAGALNQALTPILSMLGGDDLVLVQDADTRLECTWTAAALEVVDTHRCVGGVFRGDVGGGLLGQLQRSEYVRYAWDARRRGDRAMVLTGTASLFRADLLRDIAAVRGTLLPGSPGQVYDTLALTEDNEITLAAKTLGATPVSPPACTVTTEIMTTVPALWRQRLRWQRGALENLRAYGLTRTTRPYAVQQAMLAVGALMMIAYLALTTAVVATGSFGVKPLWLLVGLVFVAERLYSVWQAGWRARLLSVLMLPELGYAVLLQAVLATAYFQILTGREAAWGQAST